MRGFQGWASGHVHMGLTRASEACIKTMSSSKLQATGPPLPHPSIPGRTTESFNPLSTVCGILLPHKEVPWLRVEPTQLSRQTRRSQATCPRKATFVVVTNRRAHRALAYLPQFTIHTDSCLALSPGEDMHHFSTGKPYSPR